MPDRSFLNLVSIGTREGPPAPAAYSRAMTRDPGPATLGVHAGDDPQRFYGAVAPPIFEASLFAFPSFDELVEGLSGRKGSYVYTRGRNPTVELAEAKLAALEGGEAAKFFGSGMAAIAATILANVSQGEHVVCVRSVYGVTERLLTAWLPRFGVESSFVDGTDPAAIEGAIKETTRLIYLESPTSLTFQLQDLAAVAGIARRRGIVTAIDNSWASPLFQRPLDLGIDYSIHTASKYIGGHSDVVAGAVIASEERIERLLAQEHAMLGGVIGPFEAWLCLRGLRTLALRMRQHQESALRFAAHMEKHPKVLRVVHPGLSSHPQHDLARRQMSGFGGLFGIELAGDLDAVRRFCDALRLFRLGVSWGGFESLFFPAGAVHAKRAGSPGELPVGYARVFIGLEDVDDLIDDFEQALERI